MELDDVDEDGIAINALVVDAAPAAVVVVVVIVDAPLLAVESLCSVVVGIAPAAKVFNRCFCVFKELGIVVDVVVAVVSSESDSHNLFVLEFPCILELIELLSGFISIIVG